MKSENPEWQSLFVGRQAELERLQLAWRKAKSGDPQFVVLLAETGMGKTRLVQEFYAWLSEHEDIPGVDGYWPATLGAEGKSLRVNPKFPEEQAVRPVPWMWWGLRFGGKADEVECGLQRSLALLAPHIVSLQKEKEGRDETLTLALNSLAAAAGILGMVQFGPLLAPVVGMLGNYSALKDNIETFFSAKKLVGIKKETGVGVAQREQADQEDMVERITAYFGSLLRSDGHQGASIPVVLVVDDAQWIDTDSLAFIDRLYREAQANDWPLLIVCTHWEREWNEQQAAADPADSVAAYVARNPQVFPVPWEPVRIGKIQTDALDDVLKEGLPGLTATQQQLILERVDGNPGYLFDLLTILTTSKKKFFEGNDPRNALRAGAEKNLATLTALSHYQLNQERFGDLEEDLKALLAWASYQGTRFVDELTLEVGKRLAAEHASSPEYLGQAQNPYALIDAVSRLSHEFRQRTIHEIANHELREIEDDFEAFRTTLFAALCEWFDAGRMDEFEATERAQLLQLFVQELRQADADTSTQSYLGKALCALYSHYRMNAQQRQAIGVAVELSQVTPQDGWAFDVIERDVQWHLAQALDAHMHFAEADRVWDGLLSQMERAAAAEDGLTDERTSLYFAYVSRGRNLRASSTRHLGLNRSRDDLDALDFRLELALEYYDRALTELGTHAPREFREAPIWMLFALPVGWRERAGVLSMLGRRDEALKDVHDAIETLEWMRQEVPHSWNTTPQLELALAHVDAGRFYAWADDGAAQSEQHFTAAIEQLQAMLAAADPEMQPQLRGELANAYQERGNVAEREERFADALADFERILALPLWPEDDDWEAESPEHQHAYGQLHQNRGYAMFRMGAHGEACEACTKAIAVHEALRERLGDSWPRAFDDMLMRAYQARQDVYRQLGRDAEADRDGRMALAIGRVELWAAEMWSARGRDLLVRAEMLEADGAYAEAIPLREAHRDACGDAWPVEFRAELARAYIDYGYQLGEAGESERAGRLYAQAVALCLEAREDEGFARSRLPTTIVNASVFHANLHAAVGDADAETAELDVACDVIAQVLHAPDSDWLMSHGTFATALRRRGVCHMIAQEYPHGLERFRLAVDLRERAARQISAMGDAASPYMKDSLSPEALMAVYNDCARATAALEDNDGCFEAYSAAIATGEELGAALTLPYKEEFALAYLGRAFQQRAKGAVDDALGDCERAIAVWKDLEAGLDGTVPEGTARDIALTRQLREELEQQS